MSILDSEPMSFITMILMIIIYNLILKQFQNKIALEWKSILMLFIGGLCGWYCVKNIVIGVICGGMVNFKHELIQEIEITKSCINYAKEQKSIVPHIKTKNNK